MNGKKLPNSDSIEELARFWDSHDLTEFEDELEEVVEPVFAAGTAVTIRLKPEEAEAVKEIAASKGLHGPDLIYQWVHEKLKAA